MNSNRISVVTPTLRRPNEVVELLKNLSLQTFLPYEVILIDGAPLEERETEKIVTGLIDHPYHLRYLRHGGGTAIQRNVGIEHAECNYIAFIDDDIRLETDFFDLIIKEYELDYEKQIGGITGYITNQYLDPSTSRRWIWNRRLKLYTTFEPGRYDFESGYPVNRYLQAPHETMRRIDFMGAGCAVWRREVFDKGLRFSQFFTGLGVLEDVHLALRAQKDWKLYECGSARCIHLHALSGRENNRLVARKTAINYRFVFVDIVPKRSINQELRFWRLQIIDLLRFIFYAVKNGKKQNWETVLGKMEGIFIAMCNVHKKRENA